MPPGPVLGIKTVDHRLAESAAVCRSAGLFAPPTPPATATRIAAGLRYGALRASVYRATGPYFKLHQRSDPVKEAV